MIDAPPIPEGFVVERNQSVVLVVERALRHAVVQAGLDSVEGWMTRVGGPVIGAGRAASTVIDLAGSPVRIKALARGGIVGPIWRGRFVGARRIWSNLTTPLAARRRGVATPRPVALALAEGPPGLFRAWLALAEIEGAVDLARAWRSSRPPTRDELELILARVREMHDRGVDHRDLNLGNLLLRRDPSPIDGFILDLDRARLHDGPLPLSSRARALTRLERSAMKIGLGLPSIDWTNGLEDFPWHPYAAGDPDLGRKLVRARRFRRIGIAIHRLGGLR